ncbi:hypothetical protein [uncultured Roseovarius sp.]|uniref:hypothetical protein n=1 Tax=uncultured Roseovarius sp. TaxID=293344 RepID=UPI00260720AF|nr:hypothetical protein [uncultured Roseovarius sp.]
MPRPLILVGLFGLALTACSDTPATGYVVGVGNPSNGYAARFNDGSQGYAYWCTDHGTCLNRARAACNNSFKIRDISEVDRAASPDAVGRGFFDKARTQLHTLAVTCAG